MSGFLHNLHLELIGKFPATVFVLGADDLFRHHVHSGLVRASDFKVPVLVLDDKNGLRLHRPGTCRGVSVGVHEHVGPLVVIDVNTHV